MTDRYDGSSIDLEKAVVRYMIERRITRRYLLERIAAVGSAAALAPVIAACTSSAASPSPAPSSAAPSASAASPSASPSPTPQPSPEGELNILNWTDYLADDVISSFEDQFGVKVTQSFFSTTDEMYAKLGADGGDYDISFPISVDVPKMIEAGTIAKLDKSFLTNIGNLGDEWKNPGYDPDNTYTIPYMWWTTGVAYDTEKVEGELDSWDALWDPRFAQHLAVLDDSREAFAAALFRLGLDPNTTSDADLDKALVSLQEQKPLVRVYTTDDIGVLSNGDAWVSHAWGSDVYQVVSERPSVKFYIPKEGGIRGSDTAVMLANAKHPIASQLFLNHLLDAQVSAANTNYIGYMGPNAAAKEFIDPAILADPTVNPDQAVIASLAELLDLGADLEKYTSRWQTLRAGA